MKLLEIKSVTYLEFAFCMSLVSILCAIGSVLEGFFVIYLPLSKTK